MENAAAILEEFFGAKFQPEELETEAGDTRGLTCFDGFAHWHLLLKEEDRHLFFTADAHESWNSFPTLEIGVFYKSLQANDLSGGYTSLWIHSNSTQENVSPLAITKTREGRFSLCTTIGHQSDE